MSPYLRVSEVTAEKQNCFYILLISIINVSSPMSVLEGLLLSEEMVASCV